MWKQRLGEINGNGASQVPRSLDEVCDTKEEYTSKCGCHQTCQTISRSTTCTSLSIVALFRMYALREYQRLLRTIISFLPE
ncbi:hypothetical protein DPMN_161558 [Dreissena polymorpha]|uniref:Uncharacterized protein n=1 Tax=Dreissena polymorpha TaxID=45954 RepID=A0A9D4EPV1_DREPO|nr:hypothetical protein DPMN_161558 [Dreissena polymorpha]